jgi:drug/metabolite transporter (DMT)-like permease
MRDKKSFTFLVVASLVWGTSFPAVEYGLNTLHLNFYLIFLLRYFIGAIGSIAIVLFLKRVHLFFTLFKNFRVILIGLLNTIAVVLATYGQIYTASGKAALLLNINLIYVAIFAVLIFKEKLDRFKITGIILGIIGAYFLTIGSNFQQLTSGTLIGDLLILLAGFVWALYIILSKGLLDNKDASKSINPINLNNSMIVISFLFGLIPFLFLIFLDPTVSIMPNSLFGWISMIHLGISCTTLAYLLYNKGLAKLSPVIVSILSLIEVLMATVLGMIFLPNLIYFSIDFVIGASLILGAIVISSLK